MSARLVASRLVLLALAFTLAIACVSSFAIAASVGATTIALVVVDTVALSRRVAPQPSQRRLVVDLRDRS